MTAARIRRLTLTQFPQLSRGADRRRRTAGRAGRPERRRQDQSDRGDLAPGARPRPAPRDARRGGVRRRRRLLGGVVRRRGRARSGDARNRHRGAGGRRRADHAQVPHRPRAGSLRHRVRRSSARDLAGSGDGQAVQRPGLGAPALPRPARAGGRCRAFQPRVGAGAVAALAQPAARRIRGPIRTGSTRSSTRPPSSRSRSRRSARRPWRACRRAGRRRDPASSFPAAEIALDGWMEKLVAAAIPRPRSRTAIARC